MPENTETLDHKAEALRLLERAKEDHSAAFFNSSECLTGQALVHSNLAIAEGQERVAEELSKIGKRLDSITAVSPNVKFGSGKRYLRVKS